METLGAIHVNLGYNTQNANLVKEKVIERLVNDGLIDEDTAIKYIKEYQVIIVKKSWFKNISDKLFGDNKDGWYYKYVKLS